MDDSQISDILKESMSIARTWERKFPRFGGELEFEAVDAVGLCVAKHPELVGDDLKKYVLNSVKGKILNHLNTERARFEREMQLLDYDEQIHEPSGLIDEIMYLVVSDPIDLAIIHRLMDGSTNYEIWEEIPRRLLEKRLVMMQLKLARAGFVQRSKKEGVVKCDECGRMLDVSQYYQNRGYRMKHCKDCHKAKTKTKTGLTEETKDECSYGSTPQV